MSWSGAVGTHFAAWKTWPEVWHLDQDGTFHCYCVIFEPSELRDV